MAENTQNSTSHDSSPSDGEDGRDQDGRDDDDRRAYYSSSLPVDGASSSVTTTTTMGAVAMMSSRPTTLTTSSQYNTTLRPLDIPPATTNIPLTTPDQTASGLGSPQSVNLTSQSSKLDSIKSWSINTFKCTKQLLSERLGRGSKTVDLELETQIEILRDTQRKYLNILRLARNLAAHFDNVVQSQKLLGETFLDMSQKMPELGEEFAYNGEMQRALYKNGEILSGALSFFISSVQTLCNKTIEDTLVTVKQYETARIEYDAYRTDFEKNNATTPEAQERYQLHKEKFEKLRSDLNVKMKFLDENKVKVMHKQLLLFHNAMASYFSGNQVALDETLKQFNIKPKTPNADRTSWLETSN